MKHDFSEKESFALITGASTGIGRAIAEELASRGHNLILAALPDDKLQETVSQIKGKYQILIESYEADLTAINEPEALFQWCITKGYRINILVNNAGLGHEGAFETTPLHYIDKMMQLNMRAVVHLTHLLIPELKKNQEAFILNVGSLASFRPMPYKSIYTATKSFIFYFSRALREELHYSNIGVSVLCPGPVPTNQLVKERTLSKGFLGKIMVKYPEEVARIAIDKMFNKKPVIIPGMIPRILLQFEKLIPRKSQMRILVKMYK